MRSNNDSMTDAGVVLTRRRFVQGLAVAGAMSGLGLYGRVLAAATGQQAPQTLSGSGFRFDHR